MGAEEGAAPFLLFVVQGQRLKELAALAPSPPLLAALAMLACMTMYDDDQGQWVGWALRDLAEAAAKVADPARVWLDFIHHVWAVLVTQPPEQYDLDEVVCSIARRVRSEVLASL